MAELLVRVRKKPGQMPGDFEPGDVIVVRDDGWSWGSGELHSELTTIIKIPGVKREDIENWLCESLVAQPKTEGELGRFVAKRKRKLDIAALESMDINEIRGAPSKQAALMSVVTEKIITDDDTPPPGEM